MRAWVIEKCRPGSPWPLIVYVVLLMLAFWWFPQFAADWRTFYGPCGSMR